MRESIGDFEATILRVILDLGVNAYGVTIRQEVSARTNRDTTLATIYTTLDRLQSKGYISSQQGDPTPELGGRAEKRFKIEGAGIEVLEEKRANLLRSDRGGRGT